MRNEADKRSIQGEEDALEIRTGARLVSAMRGSDKKYLWSRVSRYFAFRAEYL